MTGPDKKTLTRVELTYDDGSRYVLRDEEARTWEATSNACVFSAHTRGLRMLKWDWEKLPPDAEHAHCEAELADLRVRIRAAFQLLSGAHKEIHRDCDLCDALRFLSDEQAMKYGSVGRARKEST